MQDIRIALRGLRRSLGFSLIVVVTLGLGIGVTTAAFSLVNGVLLNPLPYAQPERIMTLWESNPQLDVAQDQVAAGTYRDWRERSSSFEELAAYSVQTFTLSADAATEQVTAAAISPSTFRVVGVDPAVGRGFSEEEATPGNDFVVILSHGLWLQRFGGDAGVVGASLVLDDEAFTVVGVMPAGFEFPPDADDVQLWKPLAINAGSQDVRAMRVYNVVGRLEADRSVEQARIDLASVSRAIAEEHPETNRGWGVSVTPALEQVVGEYRTLILVLAGAATLILLIGCVNIASLMLARASTTQREFAIRAAMGAGRLRLIRTSLAETTSLTAVGGSLGLGLAVLSVAVLRRVLPADLPRVDELAIDVRVLVFALAISILAGLIFGLYPAYRAMRPRLMDVLGDSGRGASGGRAAGGLLNLMIAGQVTLALLLLLTAGVLLRSFAGLLSVDPGFRVDGVTTVALSLPQNDFPDQASQVQFWTELIDRVNGLPGVEFAGGASALPMSPLGIDFDLPISIEGREAVSSAEQPRAGYRAVVPGYFEVLDVPLVRGRLLDRFDREEGRPVMLLNESAERLLFPGEDPLGQILGVPMAGTIEIVGIVGDVRHDGLDAPARPELFVAFENFVVRDMHLIVRTEGDTRDLAPALRAEIAALAPGLALTRIATMQELVSDSLAQPRFNMVLILSFAVLALVLATVGIYGVVSYSVARRTGEIGIRMALGSDAIRTFQLVVGRTLAFVVAGGFAGLVAAWFSARLIQSMLYEVSPLDPLTVVTVSALLLGVAVLAAGVPAHRATRIDPTEALGRD